MSRSEIRRRWIRDHARYERIGIRAFRKAIRKAAQRIPFDNLNESVYPISIRFNLGNFDDAFIDLYTAIGLARGKKIGREINREIRKNFNPTTFEGGYKEFVTNWLLQNGGQKIVSVRQELIQYLIRFVNAKIEEGTDIRTISRELQKHILSRGFYRWQIERIVRTETTAAANLGALQAGNNANIVWEKEWISSRDSRTRRRPDDLFDHVEMDGVRVAKGEKFDVQGDLIDFPGDPKGRPANVINCRCAVSVVPKRDANGRIVFTNRLQTQL